MNEQDIRAKIHEGMWVTISIRALFETFHGLTYCEAKEEPAKEGEKQGYLLLNEDNQVVCYNDERCFIEQTGEALVTLVSEGGASDGSAGRFTLDWEELASALVSIED